MFASRQQSDYHLIAGSPAINAGSNQISYVPTVDYDGRPRIIFGRVDMGMLEFAGSPSAPVVTDDGASIPGIFLRRSRVSRPSP